MMVNLSDYTKLGFDSIEEYMVYLYFIELQTMGIVEKVIHPVEPLPLFEGEKRVHFRFKQLKTKVKKEIKDKQYLINPHIYTPDLVVKWKPTEKLIDFVGYLTKDSEIDVKVPFLMQTVLDGFYSYIEVKPSFDQNNMTRLFTSRTQPWVWEKYGIYVQLIKPLDLFKDTFVPQEVFPHMYYKVNTKRSLKGQKKYKFEYRTLEEYLYK